MSNTPVKFRIRRCNGNRKAWILLQICEDGTECKVSGTYWTSMDLDGLFSRAAARIGPEAHVELHWTIE